MCVAAAPAYFGGTRILIHSTLHPISRNPIFVLGYQNTAKNLGSGPNAMLLHFPAQKMASRNFIDTASGPNFMRDMQNAVTPRSRKFGTMIGYGSDRSIKVEVFDHGIYTVILADDARFISEALSRVPEEKRPRISKELLRFYSEHFPNWPIALCCFNNKDAIEATPLLIWYEPTTPEIFRMPAIDCHTGGAPSLGALVDVDHWLFVASHKKTDLGVRVHYTDTIDRRLRSFLPTNIVGKHLAGSMVNGDFAIRTDQFESGTHPRGTFDFGIVQRFNPSDWAQQKG